MIPVHDVFPRHPSQIREWADRHGKSFNEATLRYTHYLSMACLSQGSLPPFILHGSCVISYAFGHPRTPRDLDILMLGVEIDRVTEEQKARFCDQVSNAHSVWLRRLCPDFAERREQLRRDVHVDLFAPTGPTDPMELPLRDGTPRVVVVTDLECTIAGKLMAMIQGTHRTHRKTGQDLYDLDWLMINHSMNTTRDKIEKVVRRAMEDPRRWDERPPVELLNCEQPPPSMDRHYAAAAKAAGDRAADIFKSWTRVRKFFGPMLA